RPVETFYCLCTIKVPSPIHPVPVKTCRVVLLSMYCESSISCSPCSSEDLSSGSTVYVL
ncbi:hypothetical protein AVEN_211208-1, partial [Araneus ventricosus]